MPGLNAEDWQYEVGRGWIAEDFDERLIGATAGDELAFTTTPTGTEEPADFTVSVKKVQELVAARADRRVGGREHRRVRDGATSGATASASASPTSASARPARCWSSGPARALSDLVDDDPPEALVNAELRQRAESFVMQLQAQGIGLEQYLAATGQDQVSLMEGLKDAAARAVKVDLALRAVADAEDMQVDDDELEAEYERIAVRVGQKPAQVRKAYERSDAVPELRVELRKRKAMEWLLRTVEVVDGDGRTHRAVAAPARRGAVGRGRRGHARRPRRGTDDEDIEDDE